MKYSRTKVLFSFVFLILVLYGMGILSILIHNRGNDLDTSSVKDYGIDLMNEMDTSDDYIKNEFLDYRLDDICVVVMLLYGLISNMFYNKEKYKFLVEWFMLLSVMYLIKIMGMVTIFPPPNTTTCRLNYKHSEGASIMEDVFKVYIYRDRVCYDVYMNNDLINMIILGMLLIRYFPETILLKIKMLCMFVVNVFVLMMMRGVYTSNIITTIVTSCLIFLVYHYESLNGKGLFGYMLRKIESMEGDEDVGVVAVKDDIEMEVDRVEIAIIDKDIVLKVENHSDIKVVHDELIKELRNEILNIKQEDKVEILKQLQYRISNMQEELEEELYEANDVNLVGVDKDLDLINLR